MVKKSIVLSVLVVCLLTFSSAVFAAEIAKAQIIRTGVQGTHVIVQVKGDGVTGSPVFYLNPEKQDEQLAVILTALSLEKTVWMRTAGDAGGSLVTIVYVNY